MKFSLSNTEIEIMEVLWETKEWKSGVNFWEYFNSCVRPIKRQTMNTYLLRMVTKGILVKSKTKYMYAFSREEFERKKSEEILDTLYEGSFKKFISALSGSKKIKKEEMIELKEYLDKLN